MTCAFPPEALAAAAAVRLAVFDVDGVMTNGQLIFGPNGEEQKVFNARDGHGLVMLRNSGMPVAVITGRKSSAVSARMAELGIELVYQGQHDKLAAFADLQERLGVRPEQVCYTGDDLPDVPLLQSVGLPITVADAHPSCLRIAKYRTQATGGAGAVREICELLMCAHHTLGAQFARYGL